MVADETSASGNEHLHADALRVEALKIIEIVKARDAGKLFDAGSALDMTCEGCHLDFWYPGDREAVLKDRSSKTYIDKPAAAPAK